MIDENTENQIEENNDLEKNENADIEQTVSEETSEEIKVEAPETELVVSNNEMINYLDPSIINIKKYEYSELDEMNEIDLLEANTIYDSGLDKKERYVVKGQIVRVTDRDVFIDIGFKSEGIISKSEFNTVPPVVGEEVDVFIITFEDRRGNLILSREKAEFMLKWNELKEKFENSEIIEGKIIRRIKGGMIVDLNPVQGG